MEQQLVINPYLFSIPHVNRGMSTTIIAGPPGPEGPQGPIGPQGPASVCSCKCITISEDYNATSDDCYIGVNSSGPVTIMLPDVKECMKLIVKAEMGAPLGNRKVLIKSTKKIDGKNSVVLQSPYESVTLLYNNNMWYTI